MVAAVVLRLPAIRGLIERRVLVNDAVDAKVGSSFFEDTKVFPSGSVRFDSALWMRGIKHEWHGKDLMRVSDAREPAPRSREADA